MVMNNPVNLTGKAVFLKLEKAPFLHPPKGNGNALYIGLTLLTLPNSPIAAL